jgi:hypothetical protein
MKSIDLTGQKFGKWTVIEKTGRPSDHKSPSRPVYWKCRCECGVEKTIVAHNLRGNRTKSCGCGLGSTAFYPLYNMVVRQAQLRNLTCTLSFDEFLSFTTVTNCHYCHAEIVWDKRRKAYHLDRVDNAKGYEFSNCVVCCTKCNLSKSNRYSYDEWFSMNECFRLRRNVGS